MVRLISEGYKGLRHIAIRHIAIIEVWHCLRRIVETLLGTKFNELVWRFYHVYKRGWAEGYISAGSFSHPHRQLLVEKISANNPFTDVLEIGCASGPNLYLLAKKFPNARFVGVDINPEAVRQGKLFFKQQGIRNVSLFVGKADELERFPDKSFDVVFTDAVLLCIGPDKIRKVATEIQRVARKAIILVEHHSEQESDSGGHTEKWWLRNYTKLFQPFSNQINTTKIPPEIWGGNWGEFGYIIEVKIRARDSELSTVLLNKNRYPSVFS
jgi:ubiquinone/menaquinone biosynthesis C-methylase UbiE